MKLIWPGFRLWATTTAAGKNLTQGWLETNPFLPRFLNEVYSLNVSSNQNPLTLVITSLEVYVWAQEMPLVGGISSQSP